MCALGEKGSENGHRNGLYLEKGVGNAALPAKNYIPSNNLDRLMIVGKQKMYFILYTF